VQRREDYCGGLRSGARVARAIKSPTRSCARTSWKGLSRFFGLPAAGSCRKTPCVRADRLNTAPTKAVHTVTAALKEDQTGLRILSAFHNAAKSVGASEGGCEAALGRPSGQGSRRVAALVLSHRFFPNGGSRRRGSLRRASVPGQKLREHERDGKKTGDKRDGDHENHNNDHLAAHHGIAWSFGVTAPLSEITQTLSAH
jgi:hypothetical protein